MKKFLAAILAALFSMVIAFGISGCNNSQNPQTDNPQQTPKDPSEPQFDFHDISNWSHFETEYFEYLDYLNNEYKKICDETFCLWMPGDYDWYDPINHNEGYLYGLAYKREGLAAIKDNKTGKCSNTQIEQSIEIYPLEWNGGEKPDYATDDNCLFLMFMSGAVNLSGNEEEIKIDILADKDDPNEIYEFYSNIYLGETCVATCYVFSNSQHFTYSWIEEYLKTHIMIWN